jgi:hypothetical protein
LLDNGPLVTWAGAASATGKPRHRELISFDDAVSGISVGHENLAPYRLYAQPLARSTPRQPGQRNAPAVALAARAGREAGYRHYPGMRALAGRKPLRTKSARRPACTIWPAPVLLKPSWPGDAYRAAGNDLDSMVRLFVSGRELVDAAYSGDVDLAVEEMSATPPPSWPIGPMGPAPGEMASATVDEPGRAGPGRAGPGRGRLVRHAV